MKAFPLLPLAFLSACVGHNIGAPGTVLHPADAPSAVRRTAAEPIVHTATPPIS